MRGLGELDFSRRNSSITEISTMFGWRERKVRDLEENDFHCLDNNFRGGIWKEGK